jgi:hypothetical protein
LKGKLPEDFVLPSFSSTNVKKFVLVNVMKKYGRSGYVAPLILSLSDERR